uniref:MGS-like domain-containing protein n=1 Tax=Pseudo-nitzschia australis TaxID=44445 RepID=A0A7S4ENW9_9STRA
MSVSKTNPQSPQAERNNDKFLLSYACGSIDTTPPQERSDFRMIKALAQDVMLEMYAGNNSMSELVTEAVAKVVSRKPIFANMNSVAETEIMKEETKKSRGRSLGGKKSRSKHTRSESKVEDKTKTKKTSKKKTKKKKGRKEVSSKVPSCVQESKDVSVISTISKSASHGLIADTSTTATCIDKDFFKDVAMKLLPHRNSICIQDNNGSLSKDFYDLDVVSMGPSHRSSISTAPIQESYSTLSKDNVHTTICDEDFPAAFAPNDMRCLALVSHNGMKSTMKDFVFHYKHVLKKFRLTGTESTMKMLAEVFEGDSDIVFGPSCKSGPLGGDAELVAMMTSGNLGGILFFQDVMTSHPHQCDIECLVRQATVHNTIIATTPTTALAIVELFKIALMGEGKPQLIPSFFFSLQSPTVGLYQASQRKILRSQSSIQLSDSDSMS